MADTIVREPLPVPTQQAEVHAGIATTSMSKEERYARVMALMETWIADESGYDEEVWPELKAALDRDRLSDRKLFDE